MSCDVASRMTRDFMLILFSLRHVPSAAVHYSRGCRTLGKDPRTPGPFLRPRSGANSMIVSRVELGEIQSMRDIYRHEMHCQIMFDSIHARPGWNHEYLITEGESKLGYGSVAVAGPWQAKPTVYEFFVLPQHRTRIFDAFVAFLRSCGATAIETQSNAGLLTIMLHTFAPAVASESILFHNKVTTAYALPDALFRRATPKDAEQVAQQQLDPAAEWLVAVGGVVA